MNMDEQILDMRLKEFGQDEEDKETEEVKEPDKSMPYERIMIFGSLVPDLILENLDKKLFSFHAVLMMADVSGFTELCDKYSKNSIRASSQITEIINIYIGEMVKVVYEFNGDVVNYSGDAILAVWKMDSDQNLASVSKACDCAIYIQERIGEYVTQVNTLRVKLILTVGFVNYLVVGDESKKDFILLGPGIEDLKKTDKYSSAGQIIITASLVSAIPKKRFKFDAIVANEIWKLIGHKTGSDYMITRLRHEAGVNYLLSLRPVLRTITSEDAEMIKLFMMSAVVKAIEITGRVEQITEMRNVVIVFINVITSPETDINYLANVIENCYLKISRVVLRMDGAVNKFSLFDKDLMFLVIFGLRYYKGSVTEKTALKCSKEIKEELEKEKDLKSVSIGVTSGTVYCGVVGHPVRREFTVIGLKVNMAARLMVAYQNMIVCDRETFLHSRVDYKNFVLQEPKYLKGISNVGPVYMYLGHEKEDDQFLRASTSFPLLGRDTEMATFENMLKKAFAPRTADTKNILVFMGDSGQGKTRILEEVRIVCQDKFLCLLVELQQNNLEIPYSGIQEICRGPLGLTENSTIYERESRLYNLLKGDDYQKEFICLLNRVFNVNFAYTSEYHESDGKTREIQLRKLIVLIMKRLTIKPTVLIIDNTEYMDKISWVLLNDISKISRIVIILGIGTKAELFPFAKNLLSKKIVKIMTLGRIDQEYYIGLACQMLSVDAIPYDLLVKIQKDSEGNPGWIEGFLLVCIQTGYLYFKDDRPDLMYMEKLVRAPKYMLERGYNITVSQMVGRATGISFSHTEYEMIKACVIGEDFKNEEFSMNQEARVLTHFYKFKPHVKKILKYCAVLGDLFPREALEYMLEDASISDICEAIQTLFEMKILGCATKTYSYDPDHKFVTRKRLLNLYSDSKIECLCPFQDIRMDIIPRERYAYCQFLRFVSRDFKNAVNLLLTHGEKKDFHSRIISYFQSLDVQCSACKRHEGRWKHKGMGNVVYNNVELHDVDIPGKILLNIKKEMNDSRRLGHVSSRSCVTRTLRFSYVNLSDCQCHLIRLKLNEQFIYHCQEGGIIEAAINALIDNAILSVTFLDVLQACHLLDKAADLLVTASKLIKEPYTWKISCANGLINLLRGVCRFYMGHMSESIDLYYEALSELGCVFPQTDTKLWIKTKIEFLKLKYYVIHCQSKMGTNQSQSLSEMSTETLISETLSFLAISYIHLCNWKKAKLAAIWAFNKAFKLGNNFFILTFSLGNVLVLIPKIESGYFFVNLREFAERIVSVIAHEATYLELRSILHLYTGLFLLSECKGELEEAIEYGHVTLSISLPVQEFENKLRLIPSMIIIYLLQLDLSSAVSKLAEYESIMNSDVDSSSRIWYLALIMFFGLYCGIELMSFTEVRNFLDKCGKLIVVKDLKSEMILTCCMWLYALRKKMWNEARVWVPTILKDNSTHLNKSTLVNLIAFEGLLLQFSRIESINMHLNLVNKIIRLDKHLSDTIDEDLMWKPRYLHLIAYKHRLEFVKPLSNRSLTQAEHLSERQGNRLESLSVKSDRQSWSSDLSTGHNMQVIEPIEWKGTVFNQVTVYNLPLDDHYF